MTPFLRKILGMNWVLVFVMYGLLIFGVFMIESAARHLHVSGEVLKQFGGPGEYFAWMQKRWILLGSVAYFGAAFVDYKWIRWLGIPFYAVSMGLMMLAMQQDDAVHRLEVFGLSFQPAQLGISSGILLIAWLVQDLPKLHRWFGAPMVRIGIIGVIAAIPFLMVMKMGDMGSALVWIPVSIVALLIGGAPFRYLSFMTFIAVGLLPLLYFVALPLVSERGPERIDTWLRMMRGLEVDISDEGYAPHNISMAVGKADWKGVCSDFLMSNGVFWPIPITLSADKDLADSIADGEEVGAQCLTEMCVFGHPAIVARFLEQGRPDRVGVPLQPGVGAAGTFGGGTSIFQPSSS